ncbi:hypothetical protein AUJ84_04290 [Candidatus Pacearchaeota archaeon CG1_02_32_132]|nr:MAG: hypothetical protein AUJ84_04290 [Candidatus Pacearchaeota archaeon CG1_02_32_132]
MKKISLILLFILLATNVFAIGITPGKTDVDYNPGTSREIEFIVINTDAQDSDFAVLIQGDLNESISVSEVSFKMLAGESEKKLKYKIDIPNSLSPGLHKGEIVVVQLPKKSGTGGAFIGAAVAVATQVHVFVLYPGKYAEASLDVLGPDADGSVTFVIPVTSRGDLDLVRVRADIDIYSSLNEKIDSVTTNQIEIKSGERKEVAVVWKGDVPPGPYRAVATLVYDEQTLKLEREFDLGQQVLDVSSIVVNDFSLGGIAKFEILVENKWNRELSGTYAEMQIYNNKGEVMADFKSPTYDISALSKSVMVAFWDSEGVKAGVYDATLFLRYGSKSDQRELQLDVSNNRINVIGIGYVISEGSSSSLFSNPIVVVLAVGIVLLIIVNALWFIFLRKKLKGRSK